MVEPAAPRSDALTTSGARSARWARQSGQTIFSVLQRLVPLARRLVWGVKALSISSAVSIVVIVALLFGHGMPGPLGVGFVLVLVVVFVPAPIMLWTFNRALADVIAMPAWLRDSPEIAKGHAAELAGLVADARGPGRRRGGFAGDSVRAGRLLLAAHDDLPGYGSALRLVSPVFLIAVALAFFAAGFEVFLASVLVLVDITVRVVA